MLRSIRTTNFLELQHWCREYEQTNAYPVGGAHVRYGIAIYQLYQAMSWSDTQTTTNRDEAIAAAVLNFIMVAEAWDAALELCVDPNIFVCERQTISWEQVLLNIAAAQQHVFYGYAAKYNDSARARRRFNLQEMTVRIATIITILLLGIPTAERVNALEAAQDILVGRI